MYGVFRNPHDKQIPKLSLGVQFDQEFMGKTWKTSCCNLNRADCIYFARIVRMVMAMLGSLYHIGSIYYCTLVNVVSL